MRDAPTRRLDLITGDPDTHDWWQLLGTALVVLAFVAGVRLAVWDAPPAEHAAGALP